jgi:hypothetical protein
MYASPLDPHALEKALQYCLGFAKQMIEKEGHFYPFGAAIGRDLSVEAVGGYLGEHPEPAAVYKFLASALRTRFLKGEILGSALAVHVDIPQQYSPRFPDGIRVHLEATNFSRFIYLPYERSKVSSMRKLLGGKPTVAYGDMVPVDTPPHVCAAGS